MNRTRSALAIAILAIALSPNSTSQSINVAQKNVTTPEEAIALFTDALKDTNYYGAMQYCLVNEAAAKFDLEKSAKEYGALIWSADLLPSCYPEYAELNKAIQIGKIADQIKYFIYSIISSEQNIQQPLINPPKERIKEFVESIRADKLKTMLLVKIKKTRYLEEDYAKNKNREIAAIYGGDDRTDRIVLIKCEERYFLVGFRLLKYGDYWRIQEIFSPNQEYLRRGIVNEISIDDFESIE